MVPTSFVQSHFSLLEKEKRQASVVMHARKGNPEIFKNWKKRMKCNTWLFAMTNSVDEENESLGSLRLAPWGKKTMRQLRLYLRTGGLPIRYGGSSPPARRRNRQAGLEKKESRALLSPSQRLHLNALV